MSIAERHDLAKLLVATWLVGVLMFVLGLFKPGRTGEPRAAAHMSIGLTNGTAVLIAVLRPCDPPG